MNITKFQQSGLIFESDSGQKLAVDIASYTPISELKGYKADFVLVSHIHPDHFSPVHIKALEPKTVFLNQQCIAGITGIDSGFRVELIGPGQEKQAGDFKIISFEVDHGPNATQPLTDNQGFIIEADGKSIYFAGDMFSPSGIDTAEITVEAAFLPVGGYYTFGPNEALDFATRFKKINTLVPMHYEYNLPAGKQFMDFIRDKQTAKILNPGQQLVV